MSQHTLTNPRSHATTRLVIKMIPMWAWQGRKKYNYKQKQLATHVHTEKLQLQCAKSENTDSHSPQSLASEMQ